MKKDLVVLTNACGDDPARAHHGSVRRNLCCITPGAFSSCTHRLYPSRDAFSTQAHSEFYDFLSSKCSCLLWNAERS
jgi:hypothetical protein